jgi:hypothetical protein
LNCPNCGQPARDGKAFCGECGTPLSSVAAEPVAASAPVAETPLRRPPPPPPAPALRPPPPPPPPTEPEPQAAPPVEAPVVAQPVVPDVAPLLVVPPPPPGAPKEVEVVPFGTTEDVAVAETVAPTITITSPPPGIADVPQPTAPEQVVASLPSPSPSPESMDETRVSVRRRVGVHWRLVLPDSRHVEVSGALLVGRDPAANKKYPAAALLTIDDDAHSISKTHAVFEVDADGLWITDLDSTNGVVITQPDGTELDLDSNVRGQIQPGADVGLGDYVVQIEKD